MSHWLDTPRARPGWTAVLALLADGEWHRIENVEQLLTERSGLAPRTIAAHLHSASARGWITRDGRSVHLGPRAPEHLTGATS